MNLIKDVLSGVLVNKVIEKKITYDAAIEIARKILRVKVVELYRLLACVY